MKLIGLAGFARSGKDTVGNHLLGRYELFQYAFADPIREAAMAMFGLPASDFSGDNPDREAPDPYWGISPRDMLQRIGTEGGRDVFGQDIWIKRAHQRWSTLKASTTLDIDKMNNPTWQGMVVTDVRFDNEAEWINTQGGMVLNIERPEVGSLNGHRSENGVTPRLITHHIRNDDTLDTLYTRVNELFDQLL